MGVIKISKNKKNMLLMKLKQKKDRISFALKNVLTEAKKKK